MTLFQKIKHGIAWRIAVMSDALRDSIRSGLISKLGPFKCSVCSRRTWSFDPLPKYYHQMREKYGRAYPAESGETCNIAAYECPHCGESDRSRLYALYIKEWISWQDASQNGLFLDFAPSKGLSRFIQQLIREKLSFFEYKTADLMMNGVDFRLDICNMPEIADKSVDFFLCSHILEHVPDDRAAMRELKRILKPDGQGILMVPIVLGLDKIDEDPTVTDVAERWYRFGQNDHVRAYNREGFLERVREAGFEVLELDKRYFGRFTFWRHRIAQRSVLYVVKHPK